MRSLVSRKHDRSRSLAQLERRRAVRIVSRDVKIFYDGCDDWVDVRSPDLSADGMFINTPHHFPVGARLRLRFQLPVAHTVAQAEGEVRYCLPGIGVGLEFINLPGYMRAAIQSEVEASESNGR